MDTSLLTSLASAWPFPSKQSGSESNDLEEISNLIIQFDVERTATTLVSYFQQNGNELNNIALQFPDSLLHHAPFITHALTVLTKYCARNKQENQSTSGELSSSSPFFLYVLGDTSYGECCVDEVAAQHLETHLIVHYGNACLSPTRQTPVLYVFPTCDIEHESQACNILTESLLQLCALPDIDRVVVLYDIELHANFDANRFRIGECEAVFTGIEQRDVRIDVATVRLQNPHEVQSATDGISESLPEDVDSQFIVGPLSFDEGSVPMSCTAFLWVSAQPTGDDWRPAVRNAAMTLCTSAEPCAAFQVTSICAAGTRAPTGPSGAEDKMVDANRLLRKRFAQLIKVKDAARIGIVPGTLGVSGNVEVIERCKRVIESVDKRAYVMLVGKPNPTKLANFADMDAFVLVACPQNALLEARDYMQPVITPMELEAALLEDGDIFSRRYAMDFRELLQRKLVLEGEDEGGEGVVATRGDWSVTVNGEGGAAEFLQERSWQGLKYDQGGVDNDTDVADLSLDVEPGQYGMASRYDHEVKDE